MLSVSYSSNVREFPVILNSVDTKVVFEFVYCIVYYVMFIVCVCVMSFLTFFMFIIVLVMGIIVLLSRGLFLVFIYG